jgi:hypothetical protein
MVDNAAGIKLESLRWQAFALIESRNSFPGEVL